MGGATAAALCALSLAAHPVTAAAGEPLITPSGLEVTFLDTVFGAPGTEGLTARFRFLSPAIAAGDIAYEDAETDMQWLCETYALPRIANTGPQPSQIVISISDRDVPFGEADPESTQFFEAYRREGDTCVWEMF